MCVAVKMPRGITKVRHNHRHIYKPTTAMAWNSTQWRWLSKSLHICFPQAHLPGMCHLTMHTHVGDSWLISMAHNHDEYNNYSANTCTSRQFVKLGLNRPTIAYSSLCTFCWPLVWWRMKLIQEDTTNKYWGVSGPNLSIHSCTTCTDDSSHQ